MIRSLKLFAGCVESMRKAEKVYEKSKSPRDLSIVKDLQNKVDGWIAWINKQEDGSLKRNVPPFIGGTHSSGYPGGVSNDVIQKLKESHTPEEIERFLQSLNG